MENSIINFEKTSKSTNPDLHINAKMKISQRIHVIDEKGKEIQHIYQINLSTMQGFKYVTDEKGALLLKPICFEYIDLSKCTIKIDAIIKD